MSEKWNLAEAIEKLFPENSAEEPEIEDLVTLERHLVMDISIAEGVRDGETCVSVIFSEQCDNEEDCP